MERTAARWVVPGRDVAPRWWPAARRAGPSGGASVVTVTHNTLELTGLLLASLLRVAGPRLRRIVVVDNGSTDGGRDLAEAAARAGLVHAVLNDANLYHGPALDQGIWHLGALAAAGEDTGDWVWLLDSDCVLVDPGTLDRVTGLDVDLVGETIWNPWQRQFRLGLYSLLFRPATVWRSPTVPFAEAGDPATGFELSCRRAGLAACSFPFTARGHLVHRGQGTLAGVFRSEDTANKYFEWASDNHDPHYQGARHQARAYAMALAAFRREVGALTPGAIVTALRRARR